jgi:hypothetical protein
MDAVRGRFQIGMLAVSHVTVNRGKRSVGVLLMQCAGLTALFPATKKAVTSHRTPQFGHSLTHTSTSIEFVR